MTAVDLDRRFIRWDSGEDVDPDLLRYFGGLDGTLSWSDLLERRRVVILAEAGSGKSTELMEQRDRLAAAGLPIFLVTLQNIGRKGGVEQALGKTAWAAFESWKTSDGPAWLFLDSVDEAKKADFTFDEVLDSVAEAIDGVTGRIHIILTGRNSDWEFKRDLASLLKRIPLPPPDRAPSTVDPDEALIAAVRRETEDAPGETEQPVICAMAPLDRARVEQFACAKGVTDVEAMFEQLERQNLWSFARRPIDLDWLVAHWRASGAFGTLAEMIERSLAERLKETNSARARDDALDIEVASRALDRIGAALVLTRLDTVVVPDFTLDLEPSVSALSLATVLPDWSSGQVTTLLLRPVFDPATAGFVRLHNDNEGAVRGYLAARWLHRLRTQGNCPVSRVFDLLFADIYGMRLVKRTMRSTAAWLSLWDREVAHEVIARDPRLLMDAGDPGSLALATRIEALDALIAQIKGNPLFDMPDHDAVRRFAKPDLAHYIREHWRDHKDDAAVRTLLILLIWQGALADCVDIAIEAATSDHSDRYTPIFAGRAVAAIADTARQREFVDHLRAEAARLPAIMIWDALDTLYPAAISLDEMLALVDAARVKDDQGGLGVDYHGPRIAERAPDAAAAEALTNAILDRLDTRIEAEETDRSENDEALLETLEVAATRLLALSPADTLPTPAVDAGLRVGESRRRGSRRRGHREADLFDHLKASPERRRASIWHAVRVLRARRSTPGEIHPWQLPILGFAVALGPPDLPWLFEDMKRANEDDVRFATEAALSIWRDAGQDPAMLDAIKAAAGAPAAAAVITSWFTPRMRSEEELAMEREHQAHLERSAIEQASVDQSWIDFANRLRADPSQLRTISAPTETGTDSRLFHLWRLLNGLGDNRSHHAIRDLSPIARLIGDEVADAFRSGLISYWRHLAIRRPGGRSSDRGAISSIDLIGIAGVTQEALSRPDWTNGISDDDARTATWLATLELNEFPFWLTDLAKSHPAAVGDSLWEWIEGDLRATNEEAHSYGLQTVAGSDDAVLATVAERVLARLESAVDLPYRATEYALRIVRRVGLDPARVAKMALDRFNAHPNRHSRALYLATLFANDPDQATAALIEALAQLDEREQVALTQAVLPSVFGGRTMGGTGVAVALTLDNNAKLVRLAFAQIHPDDDHDHPSGVAYSPDERDDAESARSIVFRRLAETPGPATFRMLTGFRDDPDFPVNDRRMAEIILGRAEADAESERWRAEDVRGFEAAFETMPATSADLQRVGIARLGEITHQLLHGDFNQGRVVARLPGEVDVQNWFANALRTAQGQSYSLEREPHVADEKEPDIRLQSRIADARSPIEIKVAESWSLAELEAALTVQLQGRYLRDRDNRFGILLIVHQKPRPRGWQGPDGMLDFAGVIAHLQALATDLADADALAPQMAVVGIDVSHLADIRS